MRTKERFQGASTCKISKMRRIWGEEILRSVAVINRAPFKVLKETQVKIGLFKNYF